MKKAFLYQQVSDLLKAAIAEGKYQPGDRLPSMDELATTFRLTKLTVRRALQELQAEGVITISPARGSFVAETAPALPLPARDSRLPVIGEVSCVMRPGQTGFYHTAILESIRHELAQQMTNLLFLPAYQAPDDFPQLLRMLQQSHLDGVVYVGPFAPAVLQRLIAEGPPAVILDFAVKGLAVPMITIDNREGAAQAVGHLLELGHARIAVIEGDPCQPATGERLAGVYEALAEAGLSPASITVVEGKFTPEGGRAAMDSLLARTPRPTAVFCMNDEMAFGALQAAQQAGLSLPRELSIVGFDDVPFCCSVHPQLTTVSAPTDQMGYLAVQSLTESLRGARRPAVRMTLPTRLVIRESTTGPCA